MDCKTLDDLYEFLENETERTRREWRLTSGFKAFSDSISDIHTKNILLWEASVFDFDLIEGRAKPVNTVPNEDGTIWEYPSYEHFTEEAYLYLVKRASIVKNPFLIARYNQVLWNSNSAH